VYRRKYLKRLGAVGAAAALAGCGGGDSDDTETSGGNDDGTDDTPTDTAQPTETPTPYVDGEIKFLLSPTEPQDQLRAQYTPIRNRIDEHVDAVDTVEMQYANNYSATLTALSSGTGDIAETGPFAAALGVAQDNAEVLLQRYGYGSWTYTSVVVTRPDTDIEDLTDLEGKTVAFADPLSASGSLYPMGMIKDAGLSVPDEPGSPGGADFDPAWSSHASAKSALDSGQADAAGVGYFIVADDAREGYVDGIEEVARDDGIPRAPIMVSPQLTAEEKTTLREAFTDASNDIYHGEDGEEGTEDDLWFNDVRTADEETYQPVVDKAQSLGYGQEVFE
jgi:phosphonate transport system substrate-binding protein